MLITSARGNRRQNHVAKRTRRARARAMWKRGDRKLKNKNCFVPRIAIFSNPKSVCTPHELTLLLLLHRSQLANVSNVFLGRKVEGR